MMAWPTRSYPTSMSTTLGCLNLCESLLVDARHARSFRRCRSWTALTGLVFDTVTTTKAPVRPKISLLPRTASILTIAGRCRMAGRAGKILAECDRPVSVRAGRRKGDDSTREEPDPVIQHEAIRDHVVGCSRFSVEGWPRWLGGRE